MNDEHIQEPEAEASDLLGAVEIVIDGIEPRIRHGNYTRIVITGDNFTKDIAVAAGDTELDTNVVSPHEMHVELPDDVLEHGRTRLEIGSFELSNVWADVDLSAVPHLDVDEPPPQAEALAGDGDTDY